VISKCGQIFKRFLAAATLLSLIKFFVGLTCLGLGEQLVYVLFA